VSHTRTYVVALLSFLFAVSLQAVTYVVPSDRDLVRRADAIVIATAVESHAIATEGGAGIGTITTFDVDDQIKGTLREELRVYEPGGSLDGRIMMIPGAPRFVDGTRYLLFLHRMPNGRLTSYALGLGTFKFTVDIEGRALVARGASEHALGWNPDGSTYIEKLRDAQAFLGFVRTVAKSPNTPAVDNYTLPIDSEVHAEFKLKPAPDFVPSDYLWSSMLRWQGSASATIGYCCGPTYQPSFDGPGGASTATGMWDGTGVIHYSLGAGSSPSGGCVGAPITTAPCGGLRGSDGANTILFNDPNNELAGFGAGIVALGGVTNASGTYTFSGQTFTATHEIDAVIAKTTQFPGGISQGTFAAVVTHELGHTLGFRHADGTGDSSSPPPSCSSPLPCSSGFQAIMEHVVGRTSLGQWDNDAANTVYGAGVVCNAPSSVTVSANPTTVTSGGSSTLTATVSGGTVPFNYQWYVGSLGDTSQPISQNSASIVASGITSNTSFWVRVTATCGGAAVNSSNAVTVTVTPCSPPSGVSASASATSVTAGSSVTLTAAVTGGSQPFTYTWTANGTNLGQNLSQISVIPSQTTTYQVTVANSCSGGVASNTVTVNVVSSCSPPANVNLSASATSVITGQSVTLTSTVGSGTGPFTYAWFANNTQLSNTTSSITVTPSASTTYLVKVSNSCGSNIQSNSVIVNVGAACSTSISSISVNPTNPLPGQTFSLTANATTTSGTLSYKWYLGSQGDTSNQIGTTQSVNVTQTSVTQNYWVAVTSSCGGVAPASQITVTLNTGTCGTSTTQMCIDNARYRVTLTAIANGQTLQGTVAYQSDVFGYFTLPQIDKPTSPQVFVKVLGPVQGPNGLVPWVFYSGLTNLDYTLTVVDTQTGQTFNSYHVAPPSDPTKSVGDFDVFGAHSTQCSNVTVSSGQTSPGGSCTNTSSAICLLNRFSVTTFFKDNPSRSTNQGAGAAVPVNSDFGFFTAPSVSPNPTDIQGFIKMIDATSFTGKFWVFLGGLTDFDATFTVTDTVTGKQKIYDKPAGSTCGLNDTGAF
jgi:hypothetical protein